MQPRENMKSHKVIGQAVWLENIDQRRSKTRMFTFLQDIAKPPADISKMYLQPVWSTKTILRLLAPNLSTTANRLSATSGLIQQNQHGDYKKNDMASFAEQKKRCTRRRWSRTKSFCSECKFLKEFFQKKVLTCEIYLRGSDFDLNCFLHGGALVLFWTATNLTTFSKNFQVKLHFTHYAQGKYVMERKFMFL